MRRLIVAVRIGAAFVLAASGRPSGYWIQENMGSPTVVVFALPEGE